MWLRVLTLIAALQIWIQAEEMRCFQRVLDIKDHTTRCFQRVLDIKDHTTRCFQRVLDIKDHTTNEEVRKTSGSLLVGMKTF